MLIPKGTNTAVSQEETEDRETVRRLDNLGTSEKNVSHTTPQKREFALLRTALGPYFYPAVALLACLLSVSADAQVNCTMPDTLAHALASTPGVSCGATAEHDLHEVDLSELEGLDLELGKAVLEQRVSWEKLMSPQRTYIGRLLHRVALEDPDMPIGLALTRAQNEFEGRLVEQMTHARVTLLGRTHRLQLENTHSPGYWVITQLDLDHLDLARYYRAQPRRLRATSITDEGPAVPGDMLGMPTESLFGNDFLNAYVTAEVQRRYGPEIREFQKDHPETYRIGHEFARYLDFRIEADWYRKVLEFVQKVAPP